MHEIHAERLISSVRAGRRVLLLAESATKGRDYFNGMREELEGEVLEARLTVGREKLTVRGGGSVRVLPLRSVVAARGVLVDEVYMPIGASAGTVAAVWPSLQTSPVGLITGY
ncbi:terminase large subunit, ATPase domain [Arthrobacter phage LittleTokyo]|nr:terminase large subunit, ATPase domain [Arthrobacter phage LittleTokyo]